MKRLFLIMILSLSTICAEEFHATIPVVDMQDYYNPEKHDAFITSISRALQEVGFFAVRNSDIDIECVDRAYNATEEFFAQDLETKCQYRNTAVNGQRGYVLSETAKGKDVLDHKEFYHVGRQLNEEQQQRLGYYRNIWPTEMEFGKPVQSLFCELERLMDVIETAVAEALDLPGNHLTDMTVEGDNLLRIIHYPPMQETSDVTVWAAEHTDIDLFTILPRATNDGLEVQDKNGDWIRVKVPEDAFIINAGDMLENMTNGYFRSSRHRVVASGSTEERYSMVLFIHPRSPDPMDPLSHLIDWTGGVRRYADATRWELLMERLADLTLASPEMLEELADSGLMERLIEVGRASPDAMRQLKKYGFASPIVLKELEKQED